MKGLAIMALAAIAVSSCTAARPTVSATPAEAVAAAAAQGKLSELLREAEEQYFDSNEALYGQYLSAALATGKLSDSDAQKAEWILDYYIHKNAPGTTAADFRFATTERSENDLHAFLLGEPLIMIFYDPDCRHCSEVIKQLAPLQGNVLAVCVDSTPQRWEQTRDALPPNWIKAYDRTGILDRDLYSVRALPSIYLLDGERNVILKNPAPDTLLQQQ